MAAPHRPAAVACDRPARVARGRAAPRASALSGFGAHAQDGQTPLYVASFKGHLDVARLLLDKGAAVAIKGPDGKIVARGVTAYSAADIQRIAGNIRNIHLRIVKGIGKGSCVPDITLLISNTF